MNTNQIINMVIRQVSRVFVRRGVDAGINFATRRGKAPGEMTSAEKERAGANKQSANRARKITRVMRRMMR